jgi:hypothetical protein
MQGGRSDLFEGIRQGIRTEECGYPARPLRRVGNVYCGRLRDPKYGACDTGGIRHFRRDPFGIHYRQGTIVTRDVSLVR